MRKPEDHVDEELDVFLEENLPEPTECVVKAVTPWRTAMFRVILGLGLSGITFHFFYLDSILPFLGICLLLSGFRILRKANRWMKWCYYIAWIKGLHFVADIFVLASIFHKEWMGGALETGLMVASLILTPVLYATLWKGIREIQKEARVEQKGSNACLALLAWHLILVCMAFVRCQGLLIYGVLIVYVLILRSLWKLSKSLDEAGYVVETSPVRIPDIAIAGILAFLLISSVGGVWLWGNRYPMAWEPAEKVSDDTIESVKNQLLAMDFPLEVLEDMTAEDILDCRDASALVIASVDIPFHQGRVEKAQEMVSEDEKTGVSHRLISTKRIYDQKEMHSIAIGVALPGEANQWKIIHHFRWASDPGGFWGTECMRIWPTYNKKTGGWKSAGEITGQVLYTEDGVDYASPYVYLGEVSYTKDSMFWGQENRRDIFGTFSFPQKGSNQRGYISYTTEGTWSDPSHMELVDSWMTYTHQHSVFQFPAQTAMERCQYGDLVRDAAFHLGDHSLQFYPGMVMEGPTDYCTGQTQYSIRTSHFDTR